MKYRRGFKTEANSYARDLRNELGVEEHGLLCPWKLLNHLGYKVVKLSDLTPLAPAAVSYLTSERGQTDFSAITLPNGGDPWVVHNDSHSFGRQAANLAHEAAHGLLCHRSAALTDAFGARVYNREQEDEASWLGPALLISDEAALHIVRHEMQHAAACRIYGVSPDLLRMRLSVTGASIRIARRRSVLD